ncbi:hypothetical protein A3D77_05545 [Candidatus Gottesmanbacteria bacterium RIFCSPHIGHO2_02_FULL_39_11]|uniref:Sulfatase N-terminal domain-containing protein n=1 Tax=Candidatus Gottesmanbacteria bacterium RIFCSPHIGHO2_02_FULL_39_11 TaxID=1798382 RepID=A0A1F5ZLT9_9BACT|nr:MAG: hypothetical protein A3D77_05545 [Candidatus Gottesmanbacteria bacterium RIFCSPHIGHO2_02_FULL_39_11]
MNPLFFASSYVLTLFLHNIGELSLNKLIIPLLLILIFSFSIFLISLFLFKNKQDASFFSSLFVILFFSYHDASTILEKHYLTGDHILLPLWIALLIFSFFLTKKIPVKRKSDINQFLRIISFIIVIVPLLGIIRYQVFQRGHTTIKSRLKLPVAQKTDSLPDIYYILPDSYSAPTIFPRYFDYDNSSFVQYLTEKGFYFASQSTSNYPKTFLSLASTLNMEYLDYLSNNKNSSDQTIVNPLIEDSNVLVVLKSLGYHYYQIGSWWWPTQNNRNADEVYTVQKQNHLGFDEFTYIIINSTPINPILKRLSPAAVIGESNEDKRSIILYQFKTFPEVAKKPGPKFVFAHIIAPHGPYVFNKNCEFTTQKETDLRTDEVNYANQVSCINIKLKETIETILKVSSAPPIILLQTDEGAQFLAEKLTPPDSWGKASTELLKTKFPILSAYYLPGVSPSSLYETMTPVNSFRTIFNLYFGTNLPLLPDKNYIFPDMEHLYEFEDVTEKINKNFITPPDL